MVVVVVLAMSECVEAEYANCNSSIEAQSDITGPTTCVMPANNDLLYVY